MYDYELTNSTPNPDDFYQGYTTTDHSISLSEALSNYDLNLELSYFETQE